MNLRCIASRLSNFKSISAQHLHSQNQNDLVLDQPCHPHMADFRCPTKIQQGACIHTYIAPCLALTLSDCSSLAVMIPRKFHIYGTKSNDLTAQSFFRNDLDYVHAWLLCNSSKRVDCSTWCGWDQETPVIIDDKKSTQMSDSDCATVQSLRNVDMNIPVSLLSILNLGK